MSKTTRKKKMQKTRKAGLAPATWPTRVEAGERIGKSERSVRRLEDEGELHSLPDDRGHFRIDPDSLSRFIDRRASSSIAIATMPAPNANHLTRDANIQPDEALDGAVAAKVFKAFNSGKSRREVVELLELQPEVVQRLHQKWLELGGGLVLEERDLDELANLELDVDSAKALTTSIGLVVRDVHLHRALRIPCACGCGQMMPFTVAMLNSVVQKRALVGWHLPSHAEALKRK